jgi:hypothetical protein
LRQAKDRQAAELLLDRIYGWSKRQKQWGQNAGSWVTEMEYLCWQRQPQLHRLAIKAGGWWRWCDGVVFVPYKKWLQIFAAQRRLQRALREKLAADRALERLTQRPAEYFYRWLAKHEARKLP